MQQGQKLRLLPTCATTCRSGVVTAQESADAYDVAADDDTDVGNRLQGMVASTRRSTDISKAADKVHTLGPLAGRAMPPVYSVDDPELESAHSYSRSASWLIPGYVLCGSYPGASPGRMADDLCPEVRAAGVSTFVCLQDELPPQDQPWPEDGVPNLSDRAKWAVGNFQTYREAAGPDASFLHFGLPDLSVAKSLDALDAIVSVLHRRLENGEKLYLHCWGGRGRTGLVAACLLGAVYGRVNAEEALELVQCYYDLREPHGREKLPAGPQRKMSPETDAQKNQVRDWFSFKRIIARADIAPTALQTVYSIRNRHDPSEVIEVVGPSANHPLTRADALARVKDADVLGKGQFGQVFRGTCDDRLSECPLDGDVAIKVMPDGAPSHEQSRLALEAKVMRAMSGVRGFPVLHYDARQTVFGRPSDVMVMDLLGPSVRGLLQLSREDRPARVLRLGHDVVRCLRKLHEAGFVHNDIKPLNILYGAPGSGREANAHLLDFGSVTSTGCLDEDPSAPVEEGCELSAGGATPLFASLAQLEGRPTSPVDDLESLWYCLAFLEGGELPWQWEPRDRVANIKRRLMEEECAISSDECDAMLTSEEACSTAHCLRTYESWDCSEALHELWGVVLESRSGGAVDYDACLLALEAEPA